MEWFAGLAFLAAFLVVCIVVRRVFRMIDEL